MANQLSPLKKCGLSMSKEKLQKKIKGIFEKKTGLKGLVVKIAPAERRKPFSRGIMKSSKTQIWAVWQTATGGMDGKKIRGLTKKVTKLRDRLPAGRKEVARWTYGHLLDESPFEFCFFHYDDIKVFLDTEEYSSIVITGATINLGTIPVFEGSSGESTGEFFTMRMESCDKVYQKKRGKMKLVSDKIGLPLMTTGIPCPPVWDKDKQDFIQSSFYRFYEAIHNLISDDREVQE